MPHKPSPPLRPLQLLVIAVSLALPAAATAACPATPEQAERSARAAAAAFSAMDPRGFQAAHSALREEVGCLSAPPTPTQAALVHQAEALAAFQVKDAIGTLASLQAMHESDPGWALSADLAPPGAPLDRRDADARALPPARRTVLTLAPGQSLVVDGRPSADVPATRPSLVLVLRPSGAVAWSGILPVGGSLPSIAPPGPAVVANITKPTPSLAPKKPRKPTVPLFLSAGGAALVAGGLWTAYALDYQRVDTVAGLIASGATEDEWTDAGLDLMTADEVSSLHDRARGLEVGAQVATGLAVGLGSVGLVFLW